jgi:hypothetical protein
MTCKHSLHRTTNSFKHRSTCVVCAGALRFNVLQSAQGGRPSTDDLTAIGTSLLPLFIQCTIPLHSPMKTSEFCKHTSQEVLETSTGTVQGMRSY